MSSIESIATPVRPTSPTRTRIVGVEADLRRQVERDREPGLASLEEVAIARVRLRREANPAYCRIVHGRPRYMSGYGPRVKGTRPAAELGGASAAS